MCSGAPRPESYRRAVGISPGLEAIGRSEDTHRRGRDKDGRFINRVDNEEAQGAEAPEAVEEEPEEGSQMYFTSPSGRTTKAGTYTGGRWSTAAGTGVKARSTWMEGGGKGNEQQGGGRKQEYGSRDNTPYPPRDVSVVRP